VVNRIYPSSSDFDNLSRLRTEMSVVANTFDYSAVVVNKPWGYEYLWYQNATVAIWMLHLLPNRATSLHCHVRKRTSLIVVDGQVVCSTLEDRRRLDVLHSVVLEPCVFHTTQAISDGGAFVMEVETPPLKGDLVRLKDTFGREGTGYEGTDVYSTDFSAYEYVPMTTQHRSGSVNFRNLSMHVRTVAGRDALQTLLSRCGLIVPCDGRLAAGGGLIVEPGEAYPKNRLSLDTVEPKFPAVELLGIGTTHENQ
jgi:hypothetical protein